MSGLKLITFDLDDTLWDVKPTIIKASKILREWLLQRIPDAEPWLRPEAQREIWKQILEEAPELQHNLGELRRRVIENSIRRSGLDQKTAVEISINALDVFLEERHKVVYFEGTLESLDLLSKQFILAALTNGNADISRLGLDSYFSFAHTSASVGLGKPHPEIFHQALQSAKALTGQEVLAGQTLHVGDHPDLDIAAAAAVGMHTLHFRGCVERVLEIGEVKPTLVADNMKDLYSRIMAFSQQLSEESHSL